MSIQKLKSETLYVLSGPQGSGKSSLLKDIREKNPSTIVSYDDIREAVLGSHVYLKEGSDQIYKYYYGWTQNDNQIFSIVSQILSIHCQNKLPTIVDGMNLTDKDRKKLSKFAENNGMDFEVLIVDTPEEEIRKNNRSRSKTIDDFVVDSCITTFERTSRFPYRKIKNNDILEIEPIKITHDKVDIIGDVHGLYEDFVLLIEKAGYNIDKDLNISHPDDRTIVFVGDIVDRGPDSIKMLDVAQKNYKKHTFLLGNHELKLINYFQRHVFTNEPKEEFRGSFSSMESFNSILKLSKEKQKNYYKMLLSFHKSIVIEVEKNGIKEKIGVSHANNAIFDPCFMPRNSCVYGVTPLEQEGNTDKEYDYNYINGINDYVFIRGHIPATTGKNDKEIRDINSEYVFSLDAQQAFEGQLAFLPIDSFLENKNTLGSYNAAFKKSVLSQQSSFDFEVYEKEARKLKRGLDKAIENKLVNVKTEQEYNMKIYKFSRQVFWKGLWDDSPVLKKARGLVLDCVGQIVQHPFDKVFNYGERDAGKNLPDDYPVQIVEKVNGFLGCVTKHPYENRLLLTTTGSFDSDFVDYIDQSMTKKQKNLMLNYLTKNDLTLMFEVVHPEDPHIIEYTEQEQGLWLIGARGKEKDDKILTEESLDELAGKLDVKRPSYETTTVKDVVERAKTSNLEGWMIRDLDTQEPLFKLKTSYYLVTKFVGRMGKKKIAHMFDNPEHFKKTLDEEFVFLVDLIKERVTKDEFESLEQNKKVSFVRDIIDNNINHQFNQDTIVDMKENKKEFKK